MIIKIWGARGSVPVSGKEYLKYGGDTTCVEIRTKNDDIIIIDAGTGIRKLGNKLIEEERKRYHIILTHAHWDHLMGFPFFKPIYNKSTRIIFYGCPFAQESIKNIISKTMQTPNFPVEYSNINASVSYNNLCEKEFQIDSLLIFPIYLSHPNKGLGYKFIEGDKKFVFITDNELTFTHTGGLDYKNYLEFNRGADLLIHDAEFTEDEYVKTRTWGYSIYSDALQLALEANVKEFDLFHHNHERTDSELDKIVNHCIEIIESKKSSLECYAVQSGMEIKL